MGHITINSKQINTENLTTNLLEASRGFAKTLERHQSLFDITATGATVHTSLGKDELKFEVTVKFDGSHDKVIKKLFDLDTTSSGPEMPDVPINQQRVYKLVRKSGSSTDLTAIEFLGLNNLEKKKKISILHTHTSHKTGSDNREFLYRIFATNTIQESDSNIEYIMRIPEDNIKVELILYHATDELISDIFEALRSDFIVIPYHTETESIEINEIIDTKPIHLRENANDRKSVAELLDEYIDLLVSPDKDIPIHHRSFEDGYTDNVIAMSRKLLNTYVENEKIRDYEIMNDENKLTFNLYLWCSKKSIVTYFNYNLDYSKLNIKLEVKRIPIQRIHFEVKQYEDYQVIHVENAKDIPEKDRTYYRFVHKELDPNLELRIKGEMPDWLYNGIIEKIKKFYGEQLKILPREK